MAVPEVYQGGLPMLAGSLGASAGTFQVELPAGCGAASRDTTQKESDAEQGKKKKYFSTTQRE